MIRRIPLLLFLAPKAGGTLQRRNAAKGYEDTKVSPLDKFTSLSQNIYPGIRDDEEKSIKRRNHERRRGVRRFPYYTSPSIPLEVDTEKITPIWNTFQCNSTLMGDWEVKLSTRTDPIWEMTNKKVKKKLYQIEAGNNFIKKIFFWMLSFQGN